MRKLTKLVAITVFFSFVSAIGTAAADPAPATSSPAPRAPSIRASVEALRQSPIVLLPARPERAPAAAAAQSGGGRGLSNAAKAAIWVTAISVASVWAYKTFSVTRGTD
jgi:hypothetical protein